MWSCGSEGWEVLGVGVGEAIGDRIVGEGEFSLCVCLVFGTGDFVPSVLIFAAVLLGFVLVLVISLLLLAFILVGVVLLLLVMLLRFTLEYVWVWFGVSSIGLEEKRSGGGEVLLSCM